MTEITYKGPYGRLFSPAFVKGVGEVYFGETRQVESDFAALLVGSGEWEEVHTKCTYRKLDGKFCDKDREVGDLCRWHAQMSGQPAPTADEAKPKRTRKPELKEPADGEGQTA